MSKSRYPYAPDEFDAAAAEGSPAGVHSLPRSGWSKTWPFLMVIVIFAGLAYGGYLMLNHFRPGSDPTAETTKTTSAPPTTPSDPVTTPSEEPTPNTPTETPSTPAADVNFGASVRVLNASGVAGNAAKGAKVLTDAGYTSVVADNYTGDKLPGNTVYYASPELESTANDIAGRFGITTIELVPGLRAQVSVVLYTAVG